MQEPPPPPPPQEEESESDAESQEMEPMDLTEEAHRDQVLNWATSFHAGVAAETVIVGDHAFPSHAPGDAALALPSSLRSLERDQVTVLLLQQGIDPPTPALVHAGGNPIVLYVMRRKVQSEASSVKPPPPPPAAELTTAAVSAHTSGGKAKPTVSPRRSPPARSPTSPSHKNMEIPRDVIEVFQSARVKISARNMTQLNRLL